MAYKCIIIDDEELARRLLSNHLEQIKGFELVASCSSAIEASQLLQEHEIDLLFLDIEMPVLTGVDFFRNLRRKPQVIFTTAYRDYAVEGFELDAVDYLLKPITFARFFKALEKFRSLQEPRKKEEAPTAKTDDFIFVRKDRKQVKLLFDDIQYVEGLKDYIKIHTLIQAHIVKHSISSFYNLLDDRFIRTHRSYIVNTHKLTAFTKRDVEIGSVEIPIGNAYKEEVATFLRG
ncbi:MAG: response regulator transcription factor [Bacteroidota bacterium]